MLPYQKILEIDEKIRKEKNHFFKILLRTEKTNLYNKLKSENLC